MMELHVQTSSPIICRAIKVTCMSLSPNLWQCLLSRLSIFLGAFCLGVTEGLQSGLQTLCSLLELTPVSTSPSNSMLFSLPWEHNQFWCSLCAQFPTLNHPSGAGLGDKPCAVTLLLAHQSLGRAVVCSGRAPCDPKPWNLCPGLLPKAMQVPTPYSGTTHKGVQVSEAPWEQLNPPGKEGLLKLSASCSSALRQKTRLQPWMSWQGQLCRVQKTVVWRKTQRNDSDRSRLPFWFLKRYPVNQAEWAFCCLYCLQD